LRFFERADIKINGETNKPTRVAISRFFKDLLVNRNHKHQNRLHDGPINGDISIAPIITAAEFTFNPIDDNSTS
jgi:hypothetical protein